LDCAEMRGLVDEAIDGELDPARRQALDRHLLGCPSCRAAHEAQSALSAAVRTSADRFTASEALRSRVRAALAEAATPTPAIPRRPRRFWSWLGAGGAAAGAAMLAAGIALFLAVPSAQDRLGQELVAAHIRSLMADHLADVPSSDRHTVKPWFNGRLDLSPPVADLAAEGYPLIGGRLDYLDQRPVAALVYKHRQHVINLFVWPEPGAGASSTRLTERQGYNVLHWGRPGLTLWAVSDLNPTELEDFQRLLEARSTVEEGNQP
jgi:anti-sigma factor RsiW